MKSARRAAHALAALALLCCGTAFALAPVCINIQPAIGNTSGGQSVQLFGGALANANSVRFGGAEATVSVNSDSSIVATTPPHASGPVKVEITTSGGTGECDGTYVYAMQPVIDSVWPGAGPVAGGTAVTITGQGFWGASMVDFCGRGNGGFAVLDDRSIQAITPAGCDAGWARVRIVGIGGDLGSKDNAFKFFAPPAFTSATPAAGPVVGGNEVRITGHNLADVSIVEFDGVRADILEAGASPLVRAPAHAAGTVDVVLTSPGGSATGSYTYVVPPPAITSLSPGYGSAQGGSVVTLRGTGFIPVTSITFGGTPADFTVESDTQITAVTAPHTPGLVDVQATSADGLSIAPGAWHYLGTPVVTSVAPGAGPAAGGGTVVLGGAHFTATSAVTFDGVAAPQYSVDSDTQITATLPPVASGASLPLQAAVQVTGVAGTSGAGAAYTYHAMPTVAGVQPVAGRHGVPVVITGTGFTGASLLYFGENGTADFTVDSDTQITATAIGHPLGTVAVRVETPGGSGSGGTFRYAPAPWPEAVIPATVSTVGGTAVTITGTGFVDATRVSFYSVAESSDIDATSFQVLSDTQITAVAPAQPATGFALPVHVFGPGGDNRSAAAAVTYVERTDGACGATAAATAIPLAASLCSAGVATGLTDGLAAFTWQCTGAGGGATAQCSAPRQYVVSANAEPLQGGIVECLPSLVTYGGSVICKATPDGVAGYRFTAWSGACAGTDACQPTVTGSTVVTARFGLKTYAITTSATHGTVTCLPNPVEHGKDAACTATPDANYQFSGWTGDCSGTAECNLATVTAPRSVGAQFTLQSTDGVCGPAAGQPAAAAPGADLCATGTPSAVQSAGGHYTWECAGAHGGAAQQCSAPWADAGRGTGTVQLEGTGGWRIGTAAFSTLPAPLQPGTQTAHTPLALVLDGGSGTAQVTVAYTTPAPEGAVYLKYGPSRDGLGCTGAACAQPHWYALPGAVFSADRLRVRLTLTDGGDGDSDAVLGQITDPGLPVLLAPAPPDGARVIPVLSAGALALLAALLALLARRRDFHF